jgi:hypothetical protein
MNAAWCRHLKVTRRINFPEVRARERRRVTARRRALLSSYNRLRVEFVEAAADARAVIREMEAAFGLVADANSAAGVPDLDAQLSTQAPLPRGQSTIGGGESEEGLHVVHGLGTSDYVLDIDLRAADSETTRAAPPSALAALRDGLRSLERGHIPRLVAWMDLVARIRDVADGRDAPVRLGADPEPVLRAAKFDARELNIFERNLADVRCTSVPTCCRARGWLGSFFLD